MKPRHCFIELCALSVGLLFVCLCHPQALAQVLPLNGTDDFNDNFKDPARWGTDLILGGVGLLTETHERLEFSTSGVPAPSTLVVRPWILNFGSYTQNWEARIDASVPQLGFPESLFGLGVVLGTNGDFNNIFSIDLFESSTAGRLFLMKLRANGGTDVRVEELATTSTYAGLRITFDANTKVLSAFYDEDGPNSGYSWTLLGSTNISTAWSMTSTSVFAVWVSGRVEETNRSVISADNLFGDNFYAATGPASATAPSWQWAKRVASTTNKDTELSIGLALDSAANVYVTGWFDGTNEFGNGIWLANSPGGGQDIFVAKCNSAGVVQWARRDGSSAPPGAGTHDQGRDAGRGIGVDDAGNVYVTGGFFSNADFGPFSVSAPTNKEFFLAKYDRFGTVQWVRQSVGGNGTSGPGWNDGAYGTGLAVDSAGNCYAVGFAANVTAGRAPVTFGTTSLFNTNVDGGSTFLVKYDSNGAVQWTTCLNSPDESYATSVSLDGSGNVYVSGSFRTAVNIGGTNFTSAGAADGFVAKFSSAGVLQWARQMPANPKAGAESVYADASGRVYVAGGFGTAAGDTVSFGPSITLTNIGGGLGGIGIGDAFLATYDGVTGIAQRAVRAGGTNADAFIAGSTDSQGNVYVGGATGGLGIPTGFNAWVAKYSSNGVMQWEQFSAGTNGALLFAGPRVDAGGNIYVAGWFQTNVVFGTTTLTGRGYWDFFLAKLGFTPLTLGIVWSNAMPWLSASGEIGDRFALEYVPALTASNGWQSLATNTLTSNPFVFGDTNAGGTQTRFYRARLVP